MDWLPPIGVSRISDGGKVRPHKVPHSVRLFSKIWFDPFPFCLNLHIESRPSSYSSIQERTGPDNCPLE